MSQKDPIFCCQPHVKFTEVLHKVVVSSKEIVAENPKTHEVFLIVLCPGLLESSHSEQLLLSLDHRLTSLKVPSYLGVI